MKDHKTKLRAALSAFLAVAIASQTAAVSAFAEAPVSSLDDEQVHRLTPVFGETSEYGEQDVYFVDENGETVSFDLIPEETDRISSDAALPSSYNLANLGLVTSVKDQESTGTCWAHSALAAAESSLIKDGLATKSTDFSEAHLVWFSQGQDTDPSDPLYGDPLGIGTSCYDNGGSIYWSIGALSSWIGTANESSYPNVTALPTIAESNRYDSTYHLQKAIIFDPSDKTSIKNYLMENGALTISYYSSSNYYKKTSTYTSYYQNSYTKTNHAVTLVGWDDNFSKNNFAITPPGDGAWLIKNSWGSTWGAQSGYFYLSYYDTSINRIASMELERTNNYNKVYQHNMIAMPNYYYNSQGITGANIFTASGSDPLSAVSFFTSDASVPYAIYIYKGVSSTNPMSGTLMHAQTGVASYSGYHTVNLTKSVSIPAGTKFSVVVALNKVGTPLWTDTNAKETGTSYYTGGVGSASSSWYDLSKNGYNAAIKAFTKSVAGPVVKATAGDGQVSLSWNAVTGATKYSIFTYLNGKFTAVAQTTGTSYTVKNLTNGTKYGFLVTAYVGSSWTTYTAADIKYATPVAAVKPVFNVTPGDGQAVVTWSALSGATKYAVYTYLNGKFTAAGQTTGTAFAVKNLTNGTKYGFLVTAYIGSAWTTFTTADIKYATPVAAVKPVFKVTPGDGLAAVTWSAVPGATKYAVYTYLNGKFTAAGQTTGTAFAVKNLTNGTKYGFLVTAYIGSAWTTFTTADIKYATPVSATKPVFKVTPGDGQATVTWSAVSGATKYAVYTYLNGTFTAAGQVTGTSFTVTGLNNGTKYGFLVTAYVGSAWTTFTTADIVYATPAAAVKPVFSVTPVDGQAVVTWSAVSGATKYAIYTYLDGKFSGAGQVTGTSFTVTGLNNGTKYGFLVTAYVGSAWTTFTTADIKYATPTA